MTLFDWAFPLATPFWAVMIFAPVWRWTPRIMASPWVPLLPLVCYFALALPHFGELWHAVSRPDLGVLQAFAGSPYGAALIWAHLIAFDLFIGRWMYFEARKHGISPWIVSPILVLTIFLSPFGLVTFLAVRTARIRSRA
ncbi:MAG TPA: ABA4-like family protein [Amycolatopsis sp.]|nr:ABA4-like family protein [Amycolatopsis sp.]